MADSESAPARSKARHGLALTAAALFAGAVLAFHGLGNHAFWEDEAQTALIARNLLHLGELTGFDGTNVVGFELGSELTADLKYVKIPPQHFCLAAAGFALLGETPFGGRAPFVVAGLLAIAALAWWARRYYGDTFPWWLPAVILALSPAFLLLIRTCRYYAPGIFWSVLLLAIWTAPRSDLPPGAPEKHPRARAWLRHAIAALAVAGGFTNFYLYPAALLATLPVFLLDPRFRSREQAKLLATIYAAGLACVIWALTRGQAEEGLFNRPGGTPWIVNTAVLFWWQIRDLGPNGYLAWPLVAVFALPWISPRFAAHRDLALRGFLLVAATLAFLAVVAVTSQQPIDNTSTASARYFAPVIAFGAMTAAAALAILWRCSRRVAVPVALLLVFTNLLHPMPARSPWVTVTGRALIRSHLFDYVYENASPYRSAFTAITAWFEQVPDGTSVRILPPQAAYPVMFSRPGLRYCDQLDPAKEIEPGLRARLPDDLFTGKSAPAVIFVSPMEARLSLTESDTLTFRRSDGVNLYYRRYGRLPTHWRDTTRPELPFHEFYPPPEKVRYPGFFVYERVAASGQPAAGPAPIRN